MYTNQLLFLYLWMFLEIKMVDFFFAKIDVKNSSEIQFNQSMLETTYFEFFSPKLQYGSISYFRYLHFFNSTFYQNKWV